MSRIMQSTSALLESADSGLEKLIDDAIQNAVDFDEEEAAGAISSVYGKDDPVLNEIVEDGMDDPEENFDQVPPVQSDSVPEDYEDDEENEAMLDSRYTEDFDDATESMHALESILGVSYDDSSKPKAKRRATNSNKAVLESILNTACEGDGCEFDEDNEGWEDNVNDLDKNNPEDLIDEDETTFQPSPTKISTRKEMHPEEETTSTVESLMGLIGETATEGCKKACKKTCEGDDCDPDDCDPDDVDDTDDDDADDVAEGCAKESWLDDLMNIL